MLFRGVIADADATLHAAVLEADAGLAEQIGSGHRVGGIAGLHAEAERGRFAPGVVGPFGVDRLGADRAMETQHPVVIVGALLFGAEHDAVTGCGIAYR